MSYREALKAAGAEILEFQTFGDYSGMWVAKVSYNNQVGWIQDWYGSCGHCDAFQRDFSDSYRWTSDDYRTRLAKFGKNYLDSILPAKHFLNMWEDVEDWDDAYLARDFILNCEKQFQH